MNITREKKNAIRRSFIKRYLDTENLSESLNLRQSTIRFYFDEFKLIEEHFPEKLTDYSFFMGKEKVVKDTEWYKNLITILPKLVLEEQGPQINGAKLFRKYHELYPNEYSQPRFYALFAKWFEQNKQSLFEAKLKTKFTSDELAQLQRWRRGNDHRLWQISVLVLTPFVYHSLSGVARKIECTLHTLIAWLRLYNINGLIALSRPGSKAPEKPERKAETERNKDELIHLLRQSPKNYGIDKTSWMITDLVTVFKKVTGKSIVQSTVSRYLKSRGVRFKRSRQVMTSTDPDFSAKFEAIQNILSNLSEHEKFFSIDEYGPCSVRPKSGRMLSLKGEQPTYLKVDKGKGWFICTCALELATNQMTWFYSRKKDTVEMIKLIEVLVDQYKCMKRLYLSWDAASWHASKQLLKYLEKINAADYRAQNNCPEVLLAPLPARAPHLNVIESVFSGFSKSVIRNSDYQSLAECKAAIDRYFHKRNAYFKANPKKAGNKIWGKEKVKPVFDKANICKNL